MRLRQSIGIIGGNGWLGSAIAVSLLHQDIVKDRQLTISSRTGLGQRLSNWPGLRWTSANQDLVDQSEIVCISVRPDQFGALRIDAKDKLVISVMAGISINTLALRTGSGRIVRAMPNAAAEIGRSYTPWFANASVTEDDKELVRRLFAACGTADEMACEDHIDYMTGLTGSGPAFPALLASAMFRDAVERGIANDIAMRAVKAVMGGGGEVFAQSTSLPNELLQDFLDYRGTTAAGISAMQQHGFTQAVRAGLAAAETRAAEMRRLYDES